MSTIDEINQKISVVDEMINSIDVEIKVMKGIFRNFIEEDWLQQTNDSLTEQHFSNLKDYLAYPFSELRKLIIREGDEVILKKSWVFEY